MRAPSRSALALPLALAALLAAAPAAAQFEGDPCARSSHDRWGGDLERHCEVRPVALRLDGGPLRVEGENGGVDVRGWDRDEVAVRAIVRAHAPSESEARALARQVEVGTGGGTLRADGPETRRHRGWSVSYEVMVPRRTDLALRTSNGPIAVRSVHGRMELRTNNGPLTLREVGGSVRGRTTNGPVVVSLTGSRFDGEGLDVETTNGPVRLSLPEGYNAHLEAGTTHGPVDIDFPVTVQGRIGRRIETDLGRGGPPIRAMTTNGPVSVSRS